MNTGCKNCKHFRRKEAEVEEWEYPSEYVCINPNMAYQAFDAIEGMHIVTNLDPYKYNCKLECRGFTPKEGEFRVERT